MDTKDISILRELAEKYMEISSCGQDEKRSIWRHLNSLKTIRPPIYIRAFAWNEMPQSKCYCTDPFYRHFEYFLRGELFRSTFGDDYIFEPWINLPASYNFTGWGIAPKTNYADETVNLGAYKEEFPIRKAEDIKKLRMPFHSIDENKTAADFEKLDSAIGDIIKVNIARHPFSWVWSGDISTIIGHLRGIENIMMDMMDDPDWLHSLLAFLRDGILKTHQEAERNGDLSLADHYNQAMSYSLELEDPEPASRNVLRKQLWHFSAAQEYTCVSPEMQDEFLLKYQMPIFEKYGMVAYGCCEDLTNKIGMLRKIPNLRRIAVSPFANVEKCAEQIRLDYVMSYRPSPADMVSYSLDGERIKRILRRDLSICKGHHFDITLKDVETVERDPDRISHWVAIVKDILAEI